MQNLVIFPSFRRASQNLELPHFLNFFIDFYLVRRLVPLVPVAVPDSSCSCRCGACKPLLFCLAVPVDVYYRQRSLNRCCRYICRVGRFVDIDSIFELVLVLKIRKKFEKNSGVSKKLLLNTEPLSSCF